MTELLATRRIVFQGLGALGVAVALAGCGGGGDDAESSAPASGDVLATTDEVPVGGGLILSDQKLVITQPTAGTFVAFTATCTHQGSPLSSVSADGIVCPLHGSVFSITDGAPTKGPATEALKAVEVKQDGDQILAV